MGDVVTIGDATLYHADADDVRKMVSSDVAVIADPNYMPNNTNSKRFSGGNRRDRGEGRSDWPELHGDGSFDPRPWLDFPEVILWGANHYANLLPLGSTLVWVKKGIHLFGSFLSDAEIGWQSGGHGVYCFAKQFPPPSRMFENDGKTAAHPNQKPIALMEWCVQRTSQRVFDPFMGSGTTGVACARQGRPYTGVEIVREYFDIACERIEAAYEQGSLFPHEDIESMRERVK